MYIEISKLPFGNNGHRETLDSTWRCCVRQAIGLISGTAPHTAVVMIDLSKCFENIDRTILWAACISTGYPLYIARLSIEAYAGERVISSMYDIVGKAVKAAAGIAAGSPFATSELKAVLAGVARGIQQTHTLPRYINIFVDDFALAVHGKDRDSVVNEVVLAYQELVGELSLLKLPIAPDKTECVASDDMICDLIKLTIPCQKGANQARQLGADLNFQAGKVKPSRKRKFEQDGLSKSQGSRPRQSGCLSSGGTRTWKLKVRSKRNIKFKQRTHKCRTILSGKVYRKVLRAGLLASALYGSEISPIDPGMVARMRTAAVRAEGVWTSQVCQDVYWLILGAHVDPEFIAAAKPLVRIAREIWYLDSNAAFRQSHHDRLTGVEINELHKAIKTPDPPSMLIQAIQSSCLKLELDMETPTRWKLGQDTYIDITVSPKPSLVKALAKHWETILKRKAALALKIPPSDLEVSTFQKLFAKYNLQKKRMLVQLVAGQVYTATKAAKVGVEILSVCSICQVKQDTIEHRLIGCSTNRIPELRQGLDYRQALFKSLDYNHMVKAPRHDEPIYTQVDYWEGGCSHSAIPPFAFQQGKDLFTDGSCRNPSGPHAFSAGAAVQLESGSYLRGRYRAVSRLVPDHLEQSSFTGEWMGMMLAVTHSTYEGHDPIIRIVTDSAALLKGWEKVQHRGVSHNSKWDGLHKQLIQDSLGERHPTQILLTKVKAHRKWQDAASPQDEVHIHGNSVADQVADRCIANFLYDDAAKPKPQHKAIVNKMVEALIQAREEQPTIPKPKRVLAAWLRRHKAVPEGDKHQMLWNSHNFSCRNCCKRFPTMPSPSRPCPGAPCVSRGLVATAAKLGHIPVIISTAGKRAGLLVLCTKCGAYGADKVVLLAKPCQQQKTHRSGPIGMLMKGRHPICKDTWVDRVWKYSIPTRSKKAAFVPEDGYGQVPKRPCLRPALPQVGHPQASGPSCTVSADEAQWEALQDHARPTFAQDGEWDLDELMGLFGD